MTKTSILILVTTLLYGISSAQSSVPTETPGTRSLSITTKTFTVIGTTFTVAHPVFAGHPEDGSSTFTETQTATTKTVTETSNVAPTTYITPGPDGTRIQVSACGVAQCTIVAQNGQYQFEPVTIAPNATRPEGPDVLPGTVWEDDVGLGLGVFTCCQPVNYVGSLRLFYDNPLCTATVINTAFLANTLYQNVVSSLFGNNSCQVIGISSPETKTVVFRLGDSATTNAAIAGQTSVATAEPGPTTSMPQPTSQPTDSMIQPAKPKKTISSTATQVGSKPISISTTSHTATVPVVKPSRNSVMPSSDEATKSIHATPRSSHPVAPSFLTSLKPLKPSISGPTANTKTSKSGDSTANAAANRHQFPPQLITSTILHATIVGGSSISTVTQKSVFQQITVPFVEEFTSTSASRTYTHRTTIRPSVTTVLSTRGTRTYTYKSTMAFKSLVTFTSGTGTHIRTYVSTKSFDSISLKPYTPTSTVATPHAYLTTGTYISTYVSGSSTSTITHHSTYSVVRVPIATTYISPSGTHWHSSTTLSTTTSNSQTKTSSLYTISSRTSRSTAPTTEIRGSAILVSPSAKPATGSGMRGSSVSRLLQYFVVVLIAARNLT